MKKGSKKPKILVIVGPTASGKSDLAVRLATLYKGEVISADSRQIYKKLDIGTGKITKKEMRGIPHHMLDIASPSQRFNADKYHTKAEVSIKKILAKSHTPVICGGTGFYINAVVDNIVFPEVPPNLPLRKKLSLLPAPQLFALLKKMDPRRSKTIDAYNAHRIIRAIEIATALGKVPPPKKSPPKYDPLFIGTLISPEQLQKNIRTRLQKRIRQGMIKEAQTLHADGLSWKRMEELGLEYRYLALFLQGKLTREDMLEQLEKEIWHYAKRQMTWFKKDTRIHWYDPANFAAIKKLTDDFLLFPKI